MDQTLASGPESSHDAKQYNTRNNITNHCKTFPHLRLRLISSLARRNKHVCLPFNYGLLMQKRHNRPSETYVIIATSLFTAGFQSWYTVSMMLLHSAVKGNVVVEKL